MAGKSGGAREEGRAEIFAVRCVLQSWQSCLEQFLLTWLHASTQDPSCYSRKPTETTHSPHPPSGQHSHSSPHPESQLGMAISSGWPLSPAVLSVTSKQAFESGKGFGEQPAMFLAQAQPWEQLDKKKPNPPVFAGVRWGTPQFRGQKCTARREAPSPQSTALRQQMCFLAACRRRSLEIIILLTSNSLSQRRGNKYSVNLEAYRNFTELENYLLLNNSTKTYHQLDFLHTNLTPWIFYGNCTRGANRVVFLGPWIFPYIVLLIYFWMQQITRTPLQVCLLFSVHNGGCLINERVCVCMYMHAFLIIALCGPCSHLTMICSFLFSHPSFISKIPDTEINSCYLCAGCCMNNRAFTFYHNITCQIIKRITCY